MKYLSLPIVILMLLSGIFSTNLQAKEVPLEQIKQVATNFFYERFQQYNTLPNHLEINSIVTVGERDNPLYYGVNFENGYILVAAHDNVFPILAYSFSGSYSTPTLENNAAAWLKQYERQIAYAVSEEKPATEHAKEIWNSYNVSDFDFSQGQKFLDVEPMLTSTWNQGQYYNAFCPEDPAGSAGHCVTGCVATAMAQLAYYFRYPKTGTGSYSYEHADYGTISADFGNTTYPWGEMVNSLNAPNPAVAELIFQMGVAVDMVYGPASSGMYNHKAAYALRTYFKYSPETVYAYRDTTSMDWDSLMVAHLDNKIPLYYAGWSVPNIVGHAFIADGYQGDHFYHFNFGWSGSYDGYFYTEELTPGGNNFNLAQELIINCFPDTANYEYPTYCTGDKVVTDLKGSIDDGSGPCYNYAPLSACNWLIDPQSETDSVTAITLSFDRFNLQSGDVLNLYDGIDASAPLITSLSGDAIPDLITSPSNQLFLQFESNDSGSEAGFFATFSAIQPEWCSSMSVLDEQSGAISDGSHSFDYYNNSACMWQIVPPEAESVTIHFSSFDTEADYDKVEIYDLESNTLLASYSGAYSSSALPESVTSPSGKMLILFSSNQSIRAGGWEGWYESNVAVNELSSIPEITLYPNPADKTLTVSLSKDFESENRRISLFNYLGQRLTTSNFENEQFILDVSAFSAGLYFVEVDFGSYKRIEKVLIAR